MEQLMKNHKSCYSSIFMNSAVHISCDSAGTVVVPGLLSLSPSPQAQAFLPDCAVQFCCRVFGAGPDTCFLCNVLYGRSWLFLSCVVIKIMPVCLGGGEKEMV